MSHRTSITTSSLEIYGPSPASYHPTDFYQQQWLSLSLHRPLPLAHEYHQHYCHFNQKKWIELITSKFNQLKNAGQLAVHLATDTSLVNRSSLSQTWQLVFSPAKLERIKGVILSKFCKKMTIADKEKVWKCRIGSGFFWSCVWGHLQASYRPLLTITSCSSIPDWYN